MEDTELIFDVQRLLASVKAGVWTCFFAPFLWVEHMREETKRTCINLTCKMTITLFSQEESRGEIVKEKRGGKNN